MKSRFLYAAGAAVLAATVAGPVLGEVKLPAQMSWTAYDTGTSGFNIAVAIGQAFKDKYNSEVRVLPGSNDIARLAPLKAGRANVSAMGIGTYFAQEGLFEFGVKDWGPQPLQLILTTSSCNAIPLAVAKDTGVKELKDLKGKRIGVVVGSPALNQNAFAHLAFGGLTKDDVRLVEFSGYGAMWKGIVNNEVDAAIASTISGVTRELESSPRGIIYPPTPKADTAGWARMAKVGPYYQHQVATCGSGGISKETPLELASYPYPIFMTYATTPTDTVYSVTKGMIDQYDTYKGGAPGADGLALANQNLTWVIPYHEGAVKALKEAKAWTDAAQKHNDTLLKRQATLAAAWKTYLGTNPADDKFYEGWMKARAAALRAVNMDPVLE